MKYINLQNGIKMNLYDFKKALKKLSSQNKVFIYGCGTAAEYFKKDFSFIRVLTDLNVTGLSVEFPDIKFSRDYYFNCYLLLDNGKIVSFLTKENNADSGLQYLQEVYLEENENILLSFVYGIHNAKYYLLNDDFFTEIKKKRFIIHSFEDLKILDIFDLALCASEMNFEILLSDNINFEEYEWNLPDIRIFLPFIELILTSTRPYNALLFLEKIGLLKVLFPFLKSLSGVTQDRSLHPEGDVFEHTLHCFQFVKNPSLTLSFGLLLHDYGKAFDQREFSEHATIGETKVRDILKIYGYNERFIKDIEFLVGYHMVNSYFYRINDDGKIKIFLSRLGGDLLRLFKADTMGSVGKLDVYFDIISKLKKLSKTARNSFKPNFELSKALEI